MVLFRLVWNGGFLECQASIRASAHYEISSENLEMVGGESQSFPAGSSSVYSHMISLGGVVSGLSQSANFRPTISTLNFGYLSQLNNPPVPGVIVLSRRAGLSAKLALADILRVGYDPDGDSFQVVAGGLTEGGATIIQGGRFIFYQPPAGPSLSDVIRYRLEDTFGDTAEGRIEVVILPPPDSVSSNQELLEILPGGVTHVVFVGALNQVYQIQFTDSLVQPVKWTGLATTPSTAQPGFYEATDPAGGHGVQRFYRTIAP